MTAKCCECNLNWNISIKAEIPSDGYKCPKCRSKVNKVEIKQETIVNPKTIRKKSKNEGRVSNVLLRNRSKFSINNS